MTNILRHAVPWALRQERIESYRDVVKSEAARLMEMAALTRAWGLPRYMIRPIMSAEPPN